MITKKQIDKLKRGDKLIFFRFGGVLAAQKGFVFTFSNWDNDNEKWYWQCIELHDMGNHRHTFSIYDTELFDENIHEGYTLMDREKLCDQDKKFIEKFGA
jgi:hypothetical protein